MKIGIVSDTHSRPIPAELIKGFKSVDLIIHAGDFCDLETLKLFEKTAPIKAVQGNVDELPLKKVLPLKEVIICGGLKIGVTHGHMGPSRDAFKNAIFSFRDQKMDVVIFGHSHEPFNENVGETLYFNPGSPSLVYKSDFFSYGFVFIDGGKVKGQIVKI